jgi:enoyl-CoA hydratase
MDQFVSTISELSRNDELRAVVLTGEGDRAFIGGADIAEMAQLDTTSARDFITGLHECCAALRDLPVPAIARIAGYTLGAGLEVAAACDLRVASDTSRFGMPEVKVGIPSVIEAALLPSLIGWGRTRQMLLLGETIDAQEAAAWGLIEKVVPLADLDHAVEEWIASILEAGASAVRLQKKLIRQWEDLPLSTAIEAGIDAFEAAFESSEPRVKMNQFLSRRKATPNSQLH